MKEAMSQLMIMKSLAESSDYYKKKNSYRAITYLIGVPSEPYNSNSKELFEILGIFEKYGYRPELGDTLWTSFSLDREFAEISDVVSFRDFRYCVPKAFTLEEAAKLVSYEQEGKILVQVKDPATEPDKEDDSESKREPIVSAMAMIPMPDGTMHVHLMAACANADLARELVERRAAQVGLEVTWTNERQGHCGKNTFTLLEHYLIEGPDDLPCEPFCIGGHWEDAL